MNLNPYIQAARLRTLPLSVSGIIVGSGLASFKSLKVETGLVQTDYGIFILALFTTIGLQVLSNFANDYGDGVKGTDAIRLGEKRMVAAGMISQMAMKKTVVGTALITFCLAMMLIYRSFQTNWPYVLIFMALGLLSIAAAIKYTVGSNAYGYSGFGDLFVFLFFGWLSVAGSFFLFTKELHWELFLPASTVGLLSAAVLNLNNMRDRAEDIKHHKITLAVRLGSKGAKIYHTFIIVLAMVLSLVFTILKTPTICHFIYLLAFIPLIVNLIIVLKNKEPRLLDGQLKVVALSTFLYAVLFAIFMG